MKLSEVFRKMEEAEKKYYKDRHTPDTGPRYKGRYYCRGSEGTVGHCDDRPMTIQCEYCIWKQPDIEKQNPYQHYYGFNKPID